MAKEHIIPFDKFFLKEGESPKQIEVRNFETQAESALIAYNNGAEQYQENRLPVDQLLQLYKVYLEKDGALRLAKLEAKLEESDESVKQATQDATKDPNAESQQPEK